MYLLDELVAEHQQLGATRGNQGPKASSKSRHVTSQTHLHVELFIMTWIVITNHMYMKEDDFPFLVFHHDRKW